MMAFYQLTQITTVVLCMIWLSGFVAVLFSWKKYPRVSMLIGAALILTACGQVSETVILAINYDTQLLRTFFEMGKTGSYISRVLIFAKSTGPVLAWIMVLIVFYLLTGKQDQNES